MRRDEEPSETSSENEGLGGDDNSDGEASALGLETTPAEFYDPEADVKDEKWLSKLRKGHTSDAILSCPLCFTTVCVDCQQHEKYENQFRAMFVMNCEVDTQQVVRPAAAGTNRRPGAREGGAQQHEQRGGNEEERYNPVRCAICQAELGLRECQPSGAYHLFHVVASNS